MNMQISILIAFVGIAACVAAVFGLYGLLALTIRRYERQRLKRKGRTIRWDDALERVRCAGGYFIIAVSGNRRDLFYSDGPMPNDELLAREVYQERACLVEDYRGRTPQVDLEVNGVGESFLELDLGALD